MILSNGDRIRLRRADGWFPYPPGWCAAEVTLASPNGLSIAVSLEGLLPSKDGGRYTGGLALTMDYDHKVATSLFGDTYEFELA
jgi:hypothetical protein